MTLVAEWTAADHQFMARALKLAANGVYTTHPNPRVGCVIVNNGEIVGEGWHQKAGEAHAEVHALRAAGTRARGATAYVTLEPCSHQGRTGPCAQALVEHGVARVVAAMEDPNPRVAGSGFTILQQAGVECASGLMQAEAEALNAGFISRMRRQRPFVRVKLAASIDGRTAMASGESKWITGPAARADVQRLRARSSAIVSAAGTVMHDNPALTVRAEQLGLPNATAIAARQPLRVILDDQGLLNGNEAVFAEPNAVVYCTRDHLSLRNALPSKPHIDWVTYPADWSRNAVLVQLMEDLAQQHECNDVLVEAGPKLAGACLQAGLVDELWVYMAPKLMGHHARPLVDLPLDNMADSVALSVIDATVVGRDIRLRFRVSEQD